MNDITAPITPEELETLIRRVVREEIYRVFRKPRSLLEDQSQEGDEDPGEDAELLQEALRLLQGKSDKPADWIAWEDLEVDLDRLDKRI
jgi:hypothetical protein